MELRVGDKQNEGIIAIIAFITTLVIIITEMTLIIEPNYTFPSLISNNFPTFKSLRGIRQSQTDKN